MQLDTPVNIHLTGCHHSCAQHFVSEIGLLACKVEVSEDGDQVEGYHVLIGGGFGPFAALGRELYRDVKAEDAPRTVERILKAYVGASRVRGRELHRFCPPPRDRRAQGDDRRGGGGRMSITPRPQIPSFLPETAPFTPQQRAWLDGLFAGVFGLEGGVTPLSKQDVAKLLPGLIDAPDEAEEEVDDGAPWHDPTTPLPERMKLAEGRPLPRRLMAAMAQQDCGQCGYNCKDYADALFGKKEKRLNLCVPGGKDTSRMVKQLYQELETGAPKTDGAPAEETPAPLGEPGRSRDNPLTATLLSRYRLNKEGSEKETWHIEIDLAECGLDYQVGDSFGVFPANDPGLVDAVIAALDAPPDFPIGGRTLREVLTDGVSLSPAPDILFQLISYITGGERRKKAQALAEGRDPDGDAGVLDVLAALEKFSGIRPDPEAFIESLEPLQPRVYSISSSLEGQPGARFAHRRCGAL